MNPIGGNAQQLVDLPFERLAVNDHLIRATKTKIHHRLGCLLRHSVADMVAWVVNRRDEGVTIAAREAPN